MWHVRGRCVASAQSEGEGVTDDEIACVGAQHAALVGVAEELVAAHGRATPGEQGKKA